LVDIMRNLEARAGEEDEKEEFWGKRVGGGGGGGGGGGVMLTGTSNCTPSGEFRGS